MVGYNDNVSKEMYAHSVAMLEAPDPNCINFRHIAASLAKQCMYNGNTTTFYSVAQHSMLVADIIWDVVERDPLTQLQAMLFWSACPYVGYQSENIDILNGRRNNTEAAHIHNNINSAIFRRLGLDFYNFNTETLFRAVAISHQTAKRDVIESDRYPDFIETNPYRHPTKPIQNWMIAEELYLKKLAIIIVQTGLTLPEELEAMI